MLNSLRSRIVFAVIGIIAAAYAATTFLSQQKISESMLSTYMENSRNLLNTVTLNVENQHKSILFHKEKSLEKRKTELKNIVTIAFTIIEGHYKNHQKGLISEHKAKQLAKEELRRIRYNNDVGYIWINDLGKPIPKWIMHPTMPHLVGKIWDIPEYYIDVGEPKHLLSAFVDLCEAQEEGYIQYEWSKPTEDGLTEFQPKISFVKIFKAWGWILGTGVYLDDIEKDAEDRLNAVISELKTSFSQTKIAETGYMFIFDGNYKSVIHPLFKQGEDIGFQVNPLTRDRIADGLVSASKESGKSFSYKWNKPHAPDNYKFQKISHSNYFAPLDWYICSSVYLDEVVKPLVELRFRLVLTSAIILLISLIISLIISNNLVKPLNKLTEASRKIEELGIGQVTIPISGTHETKKLGTVLQQMIHSIENTKEELRQERDFSLHLLKTSPAFITVIQENGSIREINDALCLILNKKSEELINKDFFSSIIPKSYQDTFRQKIKNQSLSQFDLDLLTPVDLPKGQQITVEWYRTSFSTNDNKFYICIGIDVTKRKEAELELVKYRDHLEELVETRTGELKKAFSDLKVAKEQAETANHAKSEFLTNMSHEIRTPLNAILGFANIMHEEEESHERRSYLHSILTSGKSLLSLINDILDLSKVEAGQLTIDNTPVSLSELFKEIKIIFEQKIKEIGLELIIEVPDDFPDQILIDEARLRQILVNLVGNAVKFTDEGHIKLSASIQTNKEDTDTTITICIEDTGIGIPKHEQKRIFDTFTQMEHQDNKKYGGTGLGLTITKRLTEMMKGNISLTSTPDKGSKFCIHLKEITIIDKNQVPLEITGETKIDLSTIEFDPATILIVDDIAVNRQIQKGYLKTFNFNFHEADNGQRAVELALEMEPNLILMDLKMPVMDGFEATQIIKKNEITKTIPVIAISASVMSYDREKAYLYCDSYLKKPLMKKELLLELLKYLPYETKKAKQLPENSEQKNDLLQKLKGTFIIDILSTIKQDCIILNESMAFDKIELLAGELTEIAKQYNIKELLEWSTYLSEICQDTNYDATKKALIALLDLFMFDKKQ